MVLFHRKTIFIVFALIVITIFLTLIYFTFLNQPLIATNSNFDLVEDKLIFYSTIVNTSKSDIYDVEFAIVTDNVKYVDLIKVISADKNIFVSLAVPISKSLKYEVFVSAPFNRTFYFPFNLDVKAVRPVDTNLLFPSKLELNKENDFFIEVCNVSDSDIIAVEVYVKTEAGYFNKPLLPYFVDLSKGQCKTLNYMLYPINSGEITFSVITKVHKLELYKEKTIIISD